MPSTALNVATLQIHKKTRLQKKIQPKSEYSSHQETIPSVPQDYNLQMTTVNKRELSLKWKQQHLTIYSTVNSDLHCWQFPQFLE